MTHKVGLMVVALVFASAGVVGSVSEGVAQTVRDRSGTATDISAQGDQRNRGNAGNVGQQRNMGQQQRNMGQQRNVGQQQRNMSQQRNVGQQRNMGQQQHNMGQQQRNMGQQRNVGQQRDISRQRSVGQQRDISRQRDVGQRQFAKIRGASRATIAGRNYSIRRGSYRVRRDGNWRTFVGLSTLGAVAFGAAYYYPYAYIDAPAPYCEGLTEDGCQLRWRAVPTIEGPAEFQCVAYCPWQ